MTLRLGLERHHRRLTRAFDDMLTGDVAGRFCLTPAQVAAFHADGFLTGIRMIDADVVADLRARLDAICQRLDEEADLLHEIEADWLARPSEVVLHFLGAWRIDPVFHDLAFAPSLTVPAAQLLGVRKLRFWHDQVFYKPPRHPGVVPWHQDYSYWTRTGPMCHLTVNVMLDDADDSNGCLRYVRGSHRFGLLPKVPFGAAMDTVLDALSPDVRAELEVIAAPLRAGEATIHHALTLHGSGGNRTDRPRRAVVVNYMADGTRSFLSDEPLLKGVPVIPNGEPLAGAFFPVVLDLDRPGLIPAPDSHP